MGATSIEWTDFSINPIRARLGQAAVGHYCEKVSPGCKAGGVIAAPYLDGRQWLEFPR